MKKTEFSKKIFYAVAVLTFSVTIFSFIIIYKTGDTSALQVLIPAVFAEFATATGFYYNKAKSENRLKIKMNTKEESKNE